MAAHHGLEVDKWLDRDCRQTLDGRWVLNSDPITDICIYLDDDKKCTTYQARPAQCKSFPFWAENVRSDRSWSKTVSECPGIDAEDASYQNHNPNKNWMTEMLLEVLENGLQNKNLMLQFEFFCQPTLSIFYNT